jgi:hypothetical protein
MCTLGQCHRYPQLSKDDEFLPQASDHPCVNDPSHSTWRRSHSIFLDTLLVSAYRSYSASWQLSCEQMERSLGCPLPTRLAAALTEGLEKTQELCVKKYK